jgi:response regulator RpfG family c-di-GMP phosphodiesterase
MAIPDEILLKQGPLTPGEWEIMKTHTTLGREFVSGLSFLDAAATIPYSHHEHWDGSGYPDGLRGEDIPMAARIFAVVDTWDALTSDRPYRRAWPHAQAMAHLRRSAGTLFDPEVVERFLELRGR